MVSEAGGDDNNCQRRPRSGQRENFPTAGLGDKIDAVADDQTVEVRYAGALVARSGAVSDQSASGFFLGVTEPLPVGTIVTLSIGGAAKTGRVEAVVESPEVTLAGMRIRYVDGAAARPGAAVSVSVPEVALAPDDDGVSDTSGPVDGVSGGGRRRRRRR